MLVSVRRRKRTGIALFLVLVMTTVILMMVVSLYISSRNGVFVSLNQYRKTAALFVAESGLAETIELLESGAFLTPTSPLSGSLPHGGTWQVEFNDTGTSLTPSQSVNNLTNAGAAKSYRGNNTVPPYSALIVVTANFGGVERTLECVVTRHGGGVASGYALQGQGLISLDKNVTIDGIKSLLDPSVVPGSIHSNTAAGDAIVWSGDGSIAVNGTVSSAGGGIDLQGYVPGGGAPNTGVNSPVPSVDILSEISAKSSAPSPPLVPFGTSTLPSGDYYHDGDLTLDGDLVLDGGKLYVTGELRVNGSISGEGSVYVGKETRLKGDARILAESGNNVALFSHDSVTLEGFDGGAYLEALAAADPANFGKYYNDAKLTIGEMQSLLNNPTHSPTDFFVGGGQNAPLDTLRRTLGQSMPGAVAPGRQLNTLGLVSEQLALQPAGPTRDFLKAKFDSLRRFYMPGDELINDSTSAADWVAGRYEQGGAMDAMLDTSNLTLANDLFPEMIAYTNAIEYDKIGTAYFRGRVYTHGYIHATGEISVVGSVMADGDPTLGSMTLPDGTTINPGDIKLDDNTTIRFVEDLGTSSASGPASEISAETWFTR